MSVNRQCKYVHTGDLHSKEWYEYDVTAGHPSIQHTCNTHSAHGEPIDSFLKGKLKGYELVASGNTYAWNYNEDMSQVTSNNPKLLIGYSKCKGAVAGTDITSGGELYNNEVLTSLFSRSSFRDGEFSTPPDELSAYWKGTLTNCLNGQLCTSWRSQYPVPFGTFALSFSGGHVQGINTCDSLNGWGTTSCATSGGIGACSASVLKYAGTSIKQDPNVGSLKMEWGCYNNYAYCASMCFTYPLHKCNGWCRIYNTTDGQASCIPTDYAANE